MMFQQRSQLVALVFQVTMDSLVAEVNSPKVVRLELVQRLRFDQLVQKS